MSAVRRSCQTMARCTALPVARSQTTVVSRWLVMPMAAMSFARDVRLVQRLAAGGDGGSPDVLRLMLDPARRGKMLREFLLRHARDRDVGPKHDRARGRGALIDGQHKGHGVFPGGFLAALPDVVGVKASGSGGGGQYDGALLPSPRAARGGVGARGAAFAEAAGLAAPPPATRAMRGSRRIMPGPLRFVRATLSCKGRGKGSGERRLHRRRGHAAVDHDGLAGHEARCIRAEIGHGTCDLVGFADAAQRRGGAAVLQALFVFPQARGRNRS